MSKSGPYRRHTAAFKLQLCADIRSGTITRSEARRQLRRSANLIQLWFMQFVRGKLYVEDGSAETLVQCEDKIAALERKVGQRAMELDLLKKRPGLGSSAAARHHRLSAVRSQLCRSSEL